LVAVLTARQVNVPSVRVDRPAPGEELNSGEVTRARVAASVLVLRDASAGLEVLLVQRNPGARFMGGAWVFPGGASAPEEEPLDAAVREVEEEASIRLGRDRLVPFSRWITPAEVKTRFDTYFYVVEAPADAQPRVDGEECVDWRWVSPADALAAYARGELSLVFPTIKHLEQLATLGSVAGTLAAARERGAEPPPIQPRIVVSDGTASVLLPGEPGFDD
jgi:8-oxo-dGTP pyrophosphatase MutT (NUDIX family)